MHVLFVHQNFPAQFGHIAAHLVKAHGFRCTFVSQRPPGLVEGIELIQYRTQGGAIAQTHYCSRTFENAVWHAHAVYQAMENRPDIRPDLVVGHSGFGSTIFLRELYECPIINYFEYYYRSRQSDMDFRPDFSSDKLDALRARARNAMLLLDLENCDAGYSPTCWQRDRLPALFHPKVRVVFDGVDTGLWRPLPGTTRRVAGREIADGQRVVTFVARGMESMRGFDLFMKMAGLLCERQRDVLFVVVGEDRVCYGNDARVTGGRSFKEWVLSQGRYDLDRFVFTGLVPPEELARIFSISDLHVYLTVPFVLSWSLMNALSCGATVLASDTAPVREMITHGENGLLTDFFDVEAMANLAGRVLDDPAAYRHLGASGSERIRRHYSLEACLPQILDLYRDAASGRRP